MPRMTGAFAFQQANQSDVGPQYESGNVTARSFNEPPELTRFKRSAVSSSVMINDHRNQMWEGVFIA